MSDKSQDTTFQQRIVENEKMKFDNVSNILWKILSFLIFFNFVTLGILYENILKYF